MRTRKNDLILPSLRQSKGQFYISFSCYNIEKEKMIRYKIYSGFDNILSIKQALKIAEPIIQEYTQKLNNGWRPWQNKNQYEDLCDYVAISNRIGTVRHDSRKIRKYVSDFIRIKRLEISKKSLESYVSKLRLFCMWLEHSKTYSRLDISEITPDVIHDFFFYLIDERKLDTSTIDKYEVNLRQLFKYFVQRDLIQTSPVVNIPKPPKMKDMAARPISDNHLATLLKYIEKRDPQFFLACMLQFFLCCRPGNELRLLKIEDIDLSNKIVHIREANGKTGARTITIPNALAHICYHYHLAAYSPEYYIFSSRNIPGSLPVGKNYFSRRFRMFRDQLGLPKGYKFYSLKHTAAGKLLESGATIVEVMNHLGHKDFKSTLHYVKRHFGHKSEKISNFCPSIMTDIINDNI